jgi:hypothetical protein
MKKHFSIYFSLLLISSLSIASMYFLNTIDNTSSTLSQKTVAEENSEQPENMPSDTINVPQIKNVKRPDQQNYLPNVTIWNYVIQKSVESLPVLRLRDFIPFIKVNQTKINLK